MAPDRSASGASVRRHVRPGGTCVYRAGATDRSSADPRSRASRPTLGTRPASGTERAPEDGVHGVGRSRSESVTMFLPRRGRGREFGHGSVAADAECRGCGRLVDPLGTALRRPAGDRSASASWRLIRMGPSVAVTALSVETITVQAHRRSLLHSDCVTTRKLRYRTGGDVALSVSRECRSRSRERQGGRSEEVSGGTRTANRTKLPRREVTAQVEAGLSPVAEWLPMRREFVSCRAGSRRRPAAERVVDLPRPQTEGSLVPAGTRGSARRGTVGAPTSKERRLTIRWLAAITGWTPRDSGSVVARGFLRCSSTESVVGRAIATAQPTRHRRRVEVCARPQSMTATISSVTNVASGRRPGSADRRARGGSRRSASYGPAGRQSAADWRSPARWRTVAE